jgi:hypothetical protein
MKFSLVLLLFLIPAAYSLDIGLSVERTFIADALYFSYNDTTALKTFTTEIVNSGSLPYMIQARVDVYGNNSVFTAWTDKKRLMPGNNAFFALYWLPEEGGNYTARLRIYYGGEMEEEYLNITAAKGEAMDIFEITDARLLSKYVDMKVNDRREAVVIPLDLQQGWVFPQETGRGRFLIPYSAPGLVRREVSFAIASKDGQYVSRKTVVLEAKKDLATSVHNFVLAALEAI